VNEKEMRELDAHLAEHVMGYRWWFDVLALECMLCPLDETWPERKGFKLHDSKPFGARDYTDLSLFKPTTDPAAVMMVLEKCARRLQEQDNDETVSIGCDDPYFVVEKTNCIPNLRVESETLPLAICFFARSLFSK
jgi:hypothetical protein